MPRLKATLIPDALLDQLLAGADPKNHPRPHAAHGGQPPAMAYFNHIETGQQVQAVA